MPRGRKSQTPSEAKWESHRRILGALEEEPEGLRFTALKGKTKLHQDTLSNRLNGLISSGDLEYDKLKRLYSISEKGRGQIFRFRLLKLIEKDDSYLVIGGPGGASVDQAENPVLRSTIGYAFPAINTSSMVYIKNLVHKYYVLHMLYWLVQSHKTDPRSQTKQRTLEQLENELKQISSREQILAFLIDHEQIAMNLNADYLKEILRMPKPNWMEEFKYRPRSRKL